MPTNVERPLTPACHPVSRRAGAARGVAVLLIVLIVLPACRYSATEEASDREGLLAAAPDVEVLAVTLDEQTPEAARVVITLNVTNPNDFTLPVRHVAYRLDVEGLNGFDLPDDQPAVALPPGEGMPIRLAAVLTTADTDELMAARGRAYRLSGHLTTQRPGRVFNALYETGLPKPRVRFAARGVLE